MSASATVGFLACKEDGEGLTHNTYEVQYSLFIPDRKNSGIKRVPVYESPLIQLALFSFAKSSGTTRYGINREYCT
jgi:hypothetical protein